MLAALTLRAWTRYLVPLTAISALAFAAISVAYGLARTFAQLAVLDVFADPAPNAAFDAPAIHAQLRALWLVGGSAWIVQLALAGAAMPAVRSLVQGAPISQRRAALAGALGIVRAIVPCAIALLAIVVGGAALVAPGVALFGLLALTGAAAEAGLPPPAPLLDSVRVARARKLAVVAAIALMFALDFGAAYAIAAHAARDVPAKPTLDALLHVHAAARMLMLALAVLSPIPACAFAAIYAAKK